MKIIAQISLRGSQICSLCFPCEAFCTETSDMYRHFKFKLVTDFGASVFYPEKSME